MRELRAHPVYIFLASLPLVVVSSSHIGGDEKKPNSIATIKVWAWLMPPLLNSG
jgi:hypothetical protein